MRSILATAVAAALAGPPSAPVVTYDPSTDFTHYRSYSWAFANPPAAMDQTLYRQVRHSMDASLGAHGFVQGQSDTSDFAVGFTIGPRSRVHPSDYGHYAPYYGGEEAASHQAWVNRELAAQADRDDTLAIDIYDANSKHSIWHGIAPVSITPQMRPSIIEHEVDEVLNRFPPNKPCAPGPDGKLVCT